MTQDQPQPLNTDISQLDAQVQAFILKVRERRAAYNAAIATKTPWKTNCSLTIYPMFLPFVVEMGKKVNIQTIRDTSILIDAYAWLKAYQASIYEAATELGLPFVDSYCGYAYTDWMDDIKNRVRQLKLEQEKQEIEKLEKRVNAVMSETQKRAMEIASLRELIGE